MRNRVLLSAGAVALVAASCAQPEPQVLSEAPRSASATEMSLTTEPTGRESQPGRFIARCATEADGGTPGMTFFTDGSQNVTDHCLSRYYVGVQPDPGALYVADEDAGTYAPSRSTQTATEGTSSQWTPAQPRTDARTLDGRDRLDAETGNDTGKNNTGKNDRDDDETVLAGTGPEGSEPGTPDSPIGDATPTTGPPTAPPPTTVPPTTVRPTTPGDPGPASPDDTMPSTPGQPAPSTPGSMEPPTVVPTTPAAPGPQQPAPPTSVPPQSAAPTGSFGSAGSQGSPGSRGSHRLPPLPWPLAPRSGGPAS